MPADNWTQIDVSAATAAAAGGPALAAGEAFVVTSRHGLIDKKLTFARKLCATRSVASQQVVRSSELSGQLTPMNPPLGADDTDRAAAGNASRNYNEAAPPPCAETVASAGGERAFL